MDLHSESLLAVRKHHLLSGLTDREFEDLSRRMTSKALDKGQFLFHGGDPATDFFYLSSGQLELAVTSPNGDRKVIKVVKQGQMFAEAIAFMTPAIYPVTASALANSVLIQIPIPTYLAILQASPDASFRLLSDVCIRLHSHVREIERLTVQNARGRLSSFLIDHITRLDGDEASVHLDYPRRVIASRLSIKPETLSRLLRTMSDEGLIEVNEDMVHIRSVTAMRPYD